MNRILIKIEDKLVLDAIIDCKKLRISKKRIRFVIDTGSSTSYLSSKDSEELQIPLKGKISKGRAGIGGSTFERIKLPELNVYILQENNYASLRIPLYALRTKKKSTLKLRDSQALPSILGLDFLKNQNLSFHVFMAQDRAYLEQN